MFRIMLCSICWRIPDWIPPSPPLDVRAACAALLRAGTDGCVQVQVRQEYVGIHGIFEEAEIYRPEDRRGSRPPWSASVQGVAVVHKASADSRKLDGGNARIDG